MAHELARAASLWLLRSRIRSAWRELLIRLGIRRITPRRGEPLPFRIVVVEPLDTGGAYRPKHRPQDPAKDPDEPYGGESSSRGQDHGWSGCTMSSGADAMAYGSSGELVPWGGKLRHVGGTDLEGGTDLVDLRASFAAMGETLTIKSGAGWGALVDAHKAGRAIVIQGTGEVPGAGDFDGGHACCIGVETRASDGAWLFGDPLVSDWQWIAPGAIRTWAERWQSSIAFALAPKPAAAPEPEPEPPPTPAPPAAPCYSREELELRVDAATAYAVTAAGDAAVGAWLAWLRAPAPASADRWDRGSWSDPELELEELVAGEAAPDPCADLVPASWSRGGLLPPVRDALAAYLVPATWDVSSWRAAAWRD